MIPEELFSVKPEFERQNNYYNNILDKLDSSCNTILDSEIYEKEIPAAVKELKNNKAAGVDGI